MILRCRTAHGQVIGLGLIGGSLTRRLAVRGVSVVAWNHRPHPYAQAEADGIRCMRTLAELVEAQPDVIVLCNPLKAMPAILGELLRCSNRIRTSRSPMWAVSR